MNTKIGLRLQIFVISNLISEINQLIKGKVIIELFSQISVKNN